MATETYFNKIDAGDAPGVANRREVASFYASAAITAGDFVMFDTSKTGSERMNYVLQADTVALGNPLVCGVALDAATAAGQIVRVVIAGYVEGANVADAVAKGEPITVGTTAGQGRKSAAADLTNAHAIALEDADASNDCDIWVIKSW